MQAVLCTKIRKIFLLITKNVQMEIFGNTHKKISIMFYLLVTYYGEILGYPIMQEKHFGHSRNSKYEIEKGLDAWGICCLVITVS